MFKASDSLIGFRGTTMSEKAINNLAERIFVGHRQSCLWILGISRDVQTWPFAEPSHARRRTGSRKLSHARLTAAPSARDALSARARLCRRNVGGLRLRRSRAGARAPARLGDPA